MSPIVEVVRTYLELRSLQQLRPTYIDDPHVRFVRHDSIAVDHYRRIYRAVGEPWHWRDRNAWSNETLASHLASPDVVVWECFVDAATAGYFELARREDGSVEIVLFGLVGAYIGRGLGKAMLTRAAEEAWAMGALRVHLDTCTLDSPHALANYKARGFEEVGQMTYVVQLPDPDGTF